MQLRTIGGAILGVDRGQVVVIIGSGEATSFTEYVVQAIDLASHVDPNWQRHGIPVPPARSAEDAAISDIILCDLKTGNVVVIDVHAEEHLERGVCTPMIPWRTGSWTIAP